MERIWIIAACSCAIIAVVLLIVGKFDGAFVVGALGILAWFIDLRNRLSKKHGLVENVTDPKSDRKVKKDDK